MNFVFSWMYNEFWVIIQTMFLCPQNQHFQTTHSLQHFIEFRASLDITVQVKYTFRAALFYQLFYNPPSAPDQTLVQSNRKIGIKLDLSWSAFWRSCRRSQSWLTKCLPEDEDRTELRSPRASVSLISLSPAPWSKSSKPFIMYLSWFMCLFMYLLLVQL